MTSSPTPPASVPELVDRLSEATQDRFIAAWLEQPDRRTVCEEAVAMLDLWAMLREDLGIETPEWVHVAHAAMHYGRILG